MNCRRMLQLIPLFSFLAFVVPPPSYAQYVPHHSFMVNNDALSPECLACHDGSLLHPVAICTVNCSYRDPHIIDTPYPPLDKLDSYLPPEIAASFGIRFPQGLVSCISCHNLLNPARHHLAVNNQGSMLCFSCHIQ